MVFSAAQLLEDGASNAKGFDPRVLHIVRRKTDSTMQSNSLSIKASAKWSSLVGAAINLK